MKKVVSGLLVLMLVIGLFSGCDGKVNEASAGNISSNSSLNVENNGNGAAPEAVDFSKTDADMFSGRDQKPEYDERSAITVKLDKTQAAASAGSVKISGSKVTLTEEATYIISGELTDGMLIVDAQDTAKLQLVFKGVNITSKTSAALYILEADKVFITLADGTTNTLANGGSFTAIDDNNIDAALFSKQDLTLNGNGQLTVTSPAGHGIVCKDDLVFTGGSYTVNSASHGLDANDSVRITNATLNIDAGKDAIHAEHNDDAAQGFVYISGGTIKAEAEGDGIMASSYMQIADGTIDLLVGGGSINSTKEYSDSFGGYMGGGRPGGRAVNNVHSSSTEASGTSMKGLKAGNSLLISGGQITVNSADDSLHSDVSVIINGGVFSLASGDDAVHAEETLTITSGQLDISESYEGLEALHIDIRGGNIKLTADDDGLNAAGGTDQSGFTGGRDGMFGGGRGGPGGMSSNSNGSIKISGGALQIKASGDGIDANGTLEIFGGHIILAGPTRGDTAVLDYDRSAVITGGTFIGTGSTMMAQSFSDSTQGVIALQVGNQSAGTQIVLKDSKGNTIISYAPELDFAIVILSTPELIKGETYALTVGTGSGEFEAS